MKNKTRFLFIALILLLLFTSIIGSYSFTSNQKETTAMGFLSAPSDHSALVKYNSAFFKYGNFLRTQVEPALFITICMIIVMMVCKLKAFRKKYRYQIFKIFITTRERETDA